MDFVLLSCPINELQSGKKRAAGCFKKRQTLFAGRLAGKQQNRLLFSELGISAFYRLFFL